MKIHVSNIPSQRRTGYSFVHLESLRNGRKSRADALELESPDLAPALARYELCKAARTKSDGNMTSSSAALISQRIDELVEQQTQGTFAGQGRDDILTTTIGRPEHPRRVRGVPGAIGLRDYFGPTQKTPTSMSQETLRQMDLQALEEKLHSMTQGNIGTAETPTPPRVSTRGSCSAVDPTQYSGQYELLVDGDPPRIVAIGRVLEGGQTIHVILIILCVFNLYRVIGKSRGQLVQILYPKVCNQQLDSWECGFYVMCWIKTIIRAVITDDWNERFKSTSPIPEDTIRRRGRGHQTSMWTLEGCTLNVYVDVREYTSDVYVDVGADTSDVHIDVRCGPPDI
ncbi:hypothetical protein LR48_Vigan03g128900 [Vigna angularis]|uniref:Ubiquitin-like protease family profile domain-containing protein n=1 Tax=Phaseolus angularis TaxID=3914 RepID=A0A0L9U5E4_PHAAN|nr:hypothetical protein LR48_Vigan03g128900 [Vigna angularis]